MNIDVLGGSFQWPINVSLIMFFALIQALSRKRVCYLEHLFCPYETLSRMLLSNKAGLEGYLICEHEVTNMTHCDANSFLFDSHSFLHSSFLNSLLQHAFQDSMRRNLFSKKLNIFFIRLMHRGFNSIHEVKAISQSEKIYHLCLQVANLLQYLRINQTMIASCCP